MRRLRLAAAAAFAALACVALAACGGDDDGGSEGSGGGDPIKIGFAMGFTGPTNAFDGPVFNGAQIAIDDLNAKGGIDGRQIEIVKADTKSSIERVPVAAQELVEKDVDLVVTTCDYDFGGPAARVANQAGLLAIGCAGAPLYGKQGIGELTFNTEDTTPNEAGAMATFAKQKGWSSAYVLADTTIEYSKGGCEYFKDAFEEIGGQVVGEDTFQNDDPSVNAQVSRLSDSDADFIALCSYPPGVTSAIKQIRAGGVDLPIIGQLGVDGRVVSGGVPNLKDLYYLSRGSIHGEDEDPAKTELGEKYQKLTGDLASAPDAQPQFGYAAIETVAKAIEEAGSTEGQALADEIQQFKDEPLITGPTTYSEECHTPIQRPMPVFTVRNGKVTIAAQKVVPEFVPEAPC